MLNLTEHQGNQHIKRLRRLNQVLSIQLDVRIQEDQRKKQHSNILRARALLLLIFL